MEFTITPDRIQAFAFVLGLLLIAAIPSIKSHKQNKKQLTHK